MTHTIKTTFIRQGEEIEVTTNVTVQAEATVGDPVTGLSLPIGTNVIVAFSLDVSQAVDVFITASTACEIYTNDTSGGSPAAHISVGAGGVVEWHTGGQGTNPFGSTDVSKLYVTNAAITVLIIRVGIGDATP